VLSCPRMRLMGRVFISTVIVAWIILLPSLMAPSVSNQPVLWAYRVYPGMYRYPEYLLVLASRFDAKMQRASYLGKSLEVLRLNANVLLATQ
jgi:hypothetical protein